MPIRELTRGIKKLFEDGMEGCKIQRKPRPREAGLGSRRYAALVAGGVPFGSWRRHGAGYAPSRIPLPQPLGFIP